MKRTEKIISTPQTSGMKVKKAPAIETSKHKKPIASAKNIAAVPKKSGKKSKPAPAVKLSVPAANAEKTVSAKNIAQKNPAAKMNKNAAADSKTIKSSKTKSSVNSPNSATQSEKRVRAQAVEPKKTTALNKPATEKNAKKLDGKTSEKAPGTAQKIKKIAAAKSSERVKAPALKNKVVPKDVKDVKKSIMTAAVKVSAATPKTKKSGVPKPPVSKAKEIKRQPIPAQTAKTAKDLEVPKTAKRKLITAKKPENVAAATVQKRGKKSETPDLKKAAAAAKTAAGIKIKTVAPKIEKNTLKQTATKTDIAVAPIAAKPVKKKLKPLGSAVVRGKSGRYDFEMFPLDAELKDGSAIYVISKRVTDKRGRGHHKFVCIGQTESLLGEIKKHKKDKCIKQHKANVICLLREDSAANRLKIETDLREAHTIACNQK